MQHYPESALYVVATPIGNLADISLRALQVLQLVDAIACEDKRHSQPLLRQYGIDKPLLAVHEHNEAQAAGLVIERLQRGERVAYVSDAGTPAVSDPGARLVAAVRAAGLAVMPCPAPAASPRCSAWPASAARAAKTGFVFAGFLPSKAGERDQAIAALQADARAIVILEAPHRIEALARAMAVLGERPITVGRELTKQFEEIATVPAQDFAAWLAAGPQRTRGEFALVLHPSSAPESAEDGTRVLQLLLAELPLKTAVKLAADITGVGRNELYETALKLKTHEPQRRPALARPALDTRRPAGHPRHAGAVLHRHLHPGVFRHRAVAGRLAGGNAADAVGLPVRFCLHEPVPRRAGRQLRPPPGGALGHRAVHAGLGRLRAVAKHRPAGFLPRRAGFVDGRGHRGLARRDPRHVPAGPGPAGHEPGHDLFRRGARTGAHRGRLAVCAPGLAQHFLVPHRRGRGALDDQLPLPARNIAAAGPPALRSPAFDARLLAAGLQPAFLLLALASGVPFNGMFLYVLSAPAFLGEHLSLQPPSSSGSSS